jgi:hypothetical protein
LFDRKLFRGGELTANISIMNYLPRPIKDAAIRASIMLPQGGRAIAEKILPAGTLQEAEMKSMSLKLAVPADTPEGSYTLHVAAMEGGKEMSDNEYDLVIMGKNDDLPTIKATRRVGLYLGGDNYKETPDDLAQTEKMLRDFGIRYTPVKDLKDLPSAPVDLLVIGMNGLDKASVTHGKTVADWIRNGNKLLCMEQNKDMVLPWCTGLRFSGIKKSMQYFHIPFPDHPVFNGIKQDNIYLPNSRQGDRGYYRSYLLPLTKGMTAVGKTWGTTGMGMVLSEHKLGKGLFLVNTINAVSQYQSDPVIRRYLENLLSYALGDAWTGTLAYEAPKDNYVIKPPKSADRFQIDLAPYANRGLLDEKANDKAGGWDDTGPKDMRHFPTGSQMFGGIPFTIVPPEGNNGKSVIVLGDNKFRSYFPREVKGIDVKMLTAKRLIFLVSAAWTRPDNGEIGRLTVNFKGGNTILPHAVIPLVIGRNIDDWIKTDSNLSEGITTWSKKHPVTGDTCVVFAFEWVNPEPQGIIQTIDFESNGKAVPILLAITGEKP